jgi:tRNA-specific 2-thiouridylase
MTKDEVRARAAAAGLRTAHKPDSQDVCFILGTGGGRTTFLGDRIPLHPGRVVDTSGRAVGTVDAVELVTVGQRRGLTGGGGGDRRFAVSVDTTTRTVVVGSADDLLTSEVHLGDLTWTGDALEDGITVEVQASAHGTPMSAVWAGDGLVRFTEPQRRVAPGQTVALYLGDLVVGAGIAA